MKFKSKTLMKLCPKSKSDLRSQLSNSFIHRQCFHRLNHLHGVRLTAIFLQLIGFSTWYSTRFFFFIFSHINNRKRKKKFEWNLRTFVPPHDREDCFYFTITLETQAKCFENWNVNLDMNYLFGEKLEKMN